MDQLTITDGEDRPTGIVPEDVECTISAGLHDILSMIAEAGLPTVRDDIAWGIVNSFAKAADRAERRWDEASYKIRTLLDEQDGSEVAASQLEDATDKALVAEQAMELCELMREAAANLYSRHTGRFWQSLSGSRLQHAHGKTSASIDGEAFLRARAEKRQAARTPDGTPIVFAGGRPTIDAADAKTFADNLFGLLDTLKARVPDMVLVHGGDTKGVDRFAASWAASRNVQQVTFGLKRSLGQRAGFYRNTQFLNMKPKCIIALEGSGVLQRLVQDAKERNIHVIDRRGPNCTRPEQTRSTKAA